MAKYANHVPVIVEKAPEEKSLMELKSSRLAPISSASRCEQGALEGTDLRWQTAPTTQIFAENPAIFTDSPLLLEIQWFGGRRKPQRTAVFQKTFLGRVRIKFAHQNEGHEMATKKPVFVCQGCLTACASAGHHERATSKNISSIEKSSNPQFPNAVILNALRRRNTQMSAKECKWVQKRQTQVRKRAQLSAKGRKRVQKSASA